MILIRCYNLVSSQLMFKFKILIWVKKNNLQLVSRLDSNIESKSLNNTYLNIIEIFNKLLKKLNIIESQNLVVTLTSKKG